MSLLHAEGSRARRHGLKAAPPPALRPGQPARHPRPAQVLLGRRLQVLAACARPDACTSCAGLAALAAARASAPAQERHGSGRRIVHIGAARGRLAGPGPRVAAREPARGVRAAGRGEGAQGEVPDGQVRRTPDVPHPQAARRRNVDV